MKHYIQTITDYFARYRDNLTTLTIIAIGLVALIVVFVLLARSGATNVVYQPAKACDLLTHDEAKKLLGAGALATNTTEPALSGDMAISKCGYADGTADTEQMVVAAVIVRAGVNDAGVLQNQNEFVTGKPKQGIVEIKDLGDAAYFNQSNGQLNVLDGYNWLILSYGVGAAPEANQQQDLVALARVVLPQRAGQVPNF